MTKVTRKAEPALTSIAKRLGLWLPIIAALIAALLWVTRATIRSELMDWAEKNIVAKEVYLMNQQEQDRRILELEKAAKELDGRLDALERRRR